MGNLVKFKPVWHCWFWQQASIWRTRNVPAAYLKRFSFQTRRGGQPRSSC